MWYVSATPSASSAQPQTSTEPPASTAALWYAPAPTATIAFSSSIRRGAPRGRARSPGRAARARPAPTSTRCPTCRARACGSASTRSPRRRQVVDRGDGRLAAAVDAELAVRVAAPREGRGGAGAAARRCFCTSVVRALSRSRLVGMVVRADSCSRLVGMVCAFASPSSCACCSVRTAFSDVRTSTRCDSRFTSSRSAPFAPFCREDEEEEREAPAFRSAAKRALVAKLGRRQNLLLVLLLLSAPPRRAPSSWTWARAGRS